jgi:hypothetical protein
MLGQVLRTRSGTLHWTRSETPALFACRELTAGCRVQYAARGQVRGLQRIELEIWGLKPQFSISSKLSAYARLFHKASRQLAWSQRPRSRELRVTIIAAVPRLLCTIAPAVGSSEPHSQSAASWPFPAKAKSAGQLFGFFTPNWALPVLLSAACETRKHSTRDV